MSDMVERLTSWADATPDSVTSRLLRDAADEIQRLRLTGPEREAVEWCVEMAALHATECDEEMVALRGLLERTK